MTTTETEQSILKPFVISRLLESPRDLVFEAWTERERMQQWWGPKGATLLESKLDARPGGIFHYRMQLPNGVEMWGKWVIREVAGPQRLVFINSFSDAAGKTTRHPFHPVWPLEILTTVTFGEQNGQTLLTIEWLPLNPTEAERKTFGESHESMQKGWGGSLDQLADCLKKTGPGA
ncbi:MAG TPA: SRPBCC domain-containing protein [Candidatus Methylacidiphilales bacterium]|nr:SRPBCC domain-containing protein [Candidatus Methylacidiphilales bacterium]